MLFGAECVPRAGTASAYNGNKLIYSPVGAMQLSVNELHKND